MSHAVLVLLSTTLTFFKRLKLSQAFTFQAVSQYLIYCLYLLNYVLFPHSDTMTSLDLLIDRTDVYTKHTMTCREGHYYLIMDISPNWNLFLYIAHATDTTLFC